MQIFEKVFLKCCDLLKVQILGSDVNTFAVSLHDDVKEIKKNKNNFVWKWFGKPFSNINKLLQDTVKDITAN